MFLLVEFTPIRPYPGMILWTLVIFGLFWIIMRNFAFKPIIDALEKRDDSIQKAMEDSKAARAQMESFREESAEFLGEARAEQSAIMKEARAAKDQIINEAKDEARVEANKIIGSARTEINAEKTSALAELKKGSGIFALEIAEKVIQKQLMGKDDNESFANGLINDIKLN
ncbi:MAG: F0F1 ATP synthase subunit B [Saprospiraceae bacterium]